jgi:hypothetical protein
VASKRNRQLLTRDATAIVLNPNAAHPTGQEPHRDLRRPGIQGVVHQLTHHRRRALNHLSRRDLADQLVGELTDK